MSSNPNSPTDPSRVEKIIKGAKTDDVPFAFGPGATAELSVMAVDKTKAGKALLELCRKEGAKKGAFGTVRLEGGTAVLTCRHNAVSQLEKAVLAYFKLHKISLKVDLAADVGELTAAEEEDEEEERASGRAEEVARRDPAKGGADEEEEDAAEDEDKSEVEGRAEDRAEDRAKDKPKDEAAAEEDEDEEDVPEGKIFDPAVIVPLIRKAKKRARPFAFGPGPDRDLLAMHPKTEGVRLAKKLREEGAKKGVWGTVLLDGSVAVFTCEKEPFAGVKKGLKRWFKDHKLTLKFRVQGPDGDYDDPEDDEPGSDEPVANPEIAAMRLQLDNARPRIAAALAQAPGRQADIDRELAEFEDAAAMGDVAGAREALYALAALARPPQNPAIDALRAHLEKARPRLVAFFEEGGRRDEFDREVAAFEAAAAGGDAKAARAALDRLAAAARDEGGTLRGGLVALQKSRLEWDGLRKNVQAQLRDLERSILDAVRAHNADPDAADTFDEAEVAVGVGRLYRILDRLDARLVDKLDEALNADGEERRARHAEAAEIVKEYQAFVDGDDLIAEIDGNGFFPTTIRGDAQAALGALARQL
jgi:hypothetical protein